MFIGFIFSTVQMELESIWIGVMCF